MTEPSTLPRDDMALELEEVEGLINSPEPLEPAAKKPQRGRLIAAVVFCLVAIVAGLVLGGVFDAKTGEEGSSSQKDNGKMPQKAAQTSSGGEDKEVKSLWADDGGASAYPRPNQIVYPDRPLTPEKAKALAKEWGKWTLVDKKISSRPDNDYAADYPNRDIPREKMPKNAWQKDEEYLKEFLDEALALVDRAMEAILAEYGRGKKDMPKDDFDARSKPFQLDYFNFTRDAAEDRPRGKGFPDNGGWTSERSFDGLVRRVLHAVMTNDSFTMILGGHSAAAGHGNLFRQSYSMQFHKTMEPVFALLGVRLTSRNLAHGGLGTLESSMGAKDIYGDEMDMILWDSGMTEGRDNNAIDMFMRQALLSGNRVPYIFGGRFGDLQRYFQETGADVGQFGAAMDAVPMCTDLEQAKKVAYAARYMTCDKEFQDICGPEKFRANCWIDREDVTPPKPQQEKPGSQVGWHPGWRWHQIVGRSVAFTVLTALKKGLKKWKKADKFALADKDWHVGDYYAKIRKKVRGYKDTPCYNYKGSLPVRFCDIPINARTEFTPRANPELTSIQSILKPDKTGNVPHVTTKLLYTGPDVFNNFTAVPEGEVDIVSIISNGRVYPEDTDARRMVEAGGSPYSQRRRQKEIKPGLGFDMHGEFPGYCDGTYNAECNRPPDSKCLLSGHQDARGGISFSSYSGWLVMTLPSIKEGIIAIKLHSWLSAQDNPATNGWKSINNQRERQLRYRPPDYCDKFRFEFAVDGEVTSWTADEFKEHDKVVQRVVEVVTVLDNPDFTTKPKNVELAIRLTGCGNAPPNLNKVFSLTHVYFA